MDARARHRVARGAALLLACVAVVVTLGSAAFAQGSERMTSFDINVTVNDDGSADFVEHIVWDFGATEHHGIDRVLVTQQHLDDDKEHDRKYPLHVLDVTSPDAPAQFKVTDQGAGRERIRIGDPNRTITGTHEYTIRYRLDGVVNAQPSDDELYWNVTGNEWNAPIERTTVTVHSANGVTRVTCFAGFTSSSDPCTSSELGADGRTATFAQGPLSPGEQLTIVAGLKDVNGDAVEPQPFLVDRPKPFSFSRAFEPTPVTVGSATALALVFAGLVASAQWRVGRDRRAIGAPTDIAFATSSSPSEPVPLFGDMQSPVEFVPPDGIRPGELGVLRDEVAHTTDVSATIIDLAVRGYLRIEEIADVDGDVDDYRFVRLPKNDRLLPYESYLLTELFESGPEVELSSLKNTFAKSLAEVKNQLYGDVVSRGWFDSRPDRVRIKWFLIGAALAVASGGLTYVLASNTHYGLIGLPVLVAGLALAVGSKWMPRRTAVGHGVYKRVEGFGEFIEHSEKHRAEWAERKHLFTEYLPYAIAFGATKQWARTLESLGAPPPQSGGWYVGYAPYSWVAFSDRMSSFSSSAASTLSSTPGGSGASGFSGGSAGGGGGGGGGGSW
jgi:hypothetical protein